MRRAALAVLLVPLAGCDAPSPPEHLAIPGSDPERGRALVLSYGCGACHLVPGVPGARGTVGPSLEGWSGRALLAGIAANTPRNLVPWLLDPPAMLPRTGMPAVGLTEPEARDVAAFLYTIGADRARTEPPASGLNPDAVPRPLALPGRGPFAGE
ncbi:c-type cytochrome [Enterovirga aerilata]|uniref:C-type cytochrome n=1 Tax=Enterovirga aerilata TaxID=2730920 RepID=A0A849ID59_9HYPH|nr:c-type cytochrome [Enterovirga sp. DB1703]NNM75191.1 c-type cytochrome [Enterovirga sp. DB1703]